MSRKFSISLGAVCSFHTCFGFTSDALHLFHFLNCVRSFVFSISWFCVRFPVRTSIIDRKSKFASFSRIVNFLTLNFYLESLLTIETIELQRRFKGVSRGFKSIPEMIQRVPGGFRCAPWCIRGVPRAFFIREF